MNVELSIFDLSGREVTTLHRGTLSPGSYTTTWQADQVTSGVYLVQMKASDFRQVRKVTVVR